MLWVLHYIYILLITAYYRCHHFSSLSTETLPPFMSLCLSCLQLLKIFSQYTFRTASVLYLVSSVKHNLENSKRRKAYFIYPSFCLPHSFFLPGVPRFFLLSFLFCLERTSFSHSFRIGLLVTLFSLIWECLDFPFASFLWVLDSGW